MSWTEAWSMHPLEREAFYLLAAEMRGAKVDWETCTVNVDAQV